MPFRTLYTGNGGEFLLTGQRGLPSEDQQYAVYRQMLEGMAPGPVTVRTFDVDEDQLSMRSADPTMGRTWLAEGDRGSRQGLRGLRLGLARPELLRTQLRALLPLGERTAKAVLAVVAGRVFSARQVRKVHPYRVDAFDGSGVGPEGWVEEGRLRWAKSGMPQAASAGSPARALPPAVPRPRGAGDRPPRGRPAPVALNA